MPQVDTSQSTWQRCIDACVKCMQACEQCITSCLQEPDVQARMHCIQVLRDCADICSLSAQWMSRGSTHAHQLCMICADICDACAAECAKFKDRHCQDCAQFCRDCATECRNMPM
ncbi:MAG: four-helix bundle copper-binding protein [Bacillota bacterium]